jgi:hypothetical protein
VALVHAFFFHVRRYPLPVFFYQRIIFTFIRMLLLEGQTDEAWGPSKDTPFSEPIFMKLIITGILCNQTKNIENVGKIPFTSVSKMWLSLYRFSQNSHLLDALIVYADLMTQTSYCCFYPCLMLFIYISFFFTKVTTMKAHEGTVLYSCLGRKISWLYYCYQVCQHFRYNFSFNRIYMWAWEVSF